MKHYMTPKTHNEAVEHLVSLQSTISKLLDPQYREAFRVETKMVKEIRDEMIDLLAQFARAENDNDDNYDFYELMDRLGGFA